MISINPFSENRAELLSDLWKYYVPFEEIDIDDSKPIILEGGRGTGKTMFFQCNSWQEQLSEFSTGDNDTQHTHALEKIISLNRLGIYYKVDIAFIGVMEGESIPHSQWIGLFNTYLALCILKKVFEFLYLCEQTNLFGANDILEVSRAYYRCIRGDESRKCYSFKTLINDCDKALDIVEDIVNTQHYDSSILRLTTAGTAVNVIYKKIKEIKIFEKLVLKIFIDECESLSEWQQKIINTLVKHSDNKIVYNIGTRPCGIKTVETMGIDGASEIIQEVHDYKYIRLDDIFILSKKYVALLEKICEKRLSLIQDKCKAKGKIPVDIKYYLGEYSIKQEIARFEESGKNAPHRQWLKDKIIEQSEQQEKNALYINVLCDEASLLESRLHYAILLRAKQYRPSLENLLSAYLAWKNNGKAEEKKQYSNWMHNAETGLIFLLANELRMSKLYYGFDTFVKLSSGVIRYFLELCEQAFNLALNDNFDWNNVQMIPCEVQSRAARYVSKYKIDEIVIIPN